MNKESTFNLWCSINNHGDGSASVSIHKTEDEAEKEDNDQDDCYSESTVSKIQLRIIDGKICRFNEYYNYEKSEWIREWTELESE
jgi:hypothetical protein